MRVWRRIDTIPYEKDRVLVTDIDENLKARYYTLHCDGTQYEFATLDHSIEWEGIEIFLLFNKGFKEVTNDGLQRFFEVEGSNSSTKRV